MASLATTRTIHSQDTNHARPRWSLGTLAVLVALSILAAALALPAKAAEPNSRITAIDSRTGLITAKELASGRTFQFSVTDAATLKRFQVGQPLEADFAAQMVSILGTLSRYKIVSGRGSVPGREVGVPSPGTGLKPAPSPAQAPTVKRVPGVQVVQPVVTTPCTSTTATSAIFLKLEGIEGESQDACHKGEIELLSFQTGGSGPSGFTVAKQIDKASPKLWLACATGEHIGRGTITLLTSGGSQPQLLTYTLTDLIITGINLTVGLTTREEVNLNFGRFQTKVENTNLTLQPSSGPSAVDIFLKLDGIQGDSQDATHRGEITVLSFIGGVDTASTSQGQTAPRAQIRDFVVEKSIDQASPALLLYRVTGQHIGEAVLTLRHRGGLDFLRYKLRDVLISADFQVAGATQREQVSLKFGMFGVDYSASGFKGVPDVRPSGRLLEQ